MKRSCFLPLLLVAHRSILGTLVPRSVWEGLWPAKFHEKIASGRQNGNGGQRRGRRHSGQVEAVALYGPERAQLSE